MRKPLFALALATAFTLGTLTWFGAFLGACGKTNTAGNADIEETAQQVGDVMASIDESGGSTGALAWTLLDPSLEASHLFARRAPEELGFRGFTRALSLITPAHATACSL